MRAHGLTKAASMGPVADLVRRSGGRPDLLFRRNGLSLRLAEDPERLILLRDQLSLVEAAARAVGDHGFGARLSTEVGFLGLGEYGRRMASSATLGEMARLANSTMAVALQSATLMRLDVSGDLARWTYVVTEHVEVGRQQNELLALGYQLDVLRHFGGRHWQPTRVELPGLRRPMKIAAEAVFGCELSVGARAGVVFPARLLALSTPGRSGAGGTDLSVEVPAAHDLLACVDGLLDSVLLEGRPTLPQLARRLETRPRTLQRHLAERGTSFDSLLRGALHRRARQLLASGCSVTTTAIELGYSDTAHFSRAYRSWTGVPPSAHRMVPVLS